MSDEQLHLIDPVAPLTRADARQRLNAYLEQDLRTLADEHGVTVWKNGALNKGWAGHVVERLLGLSPNADQRPDFGDWELKVVPLVMTSSGGVSVKESMSVTMFTEAHILDTEFEQSHLLEKLRRLLLVGRFYIDGSESSSPLVAVREFDLGRGALYDAIRA
ncbi:MAG: MutH/Sau3AI family endonuclease, partial [Pseudomonadota bacterium]|nr:MutH/Sau3AI family endonuclease [Pseudomonadota bacterium]